MKTLYFDLGMGAAGDMLTAALLELFPKEEQNQIVDEINHIGLDDVSVTAESTSRCGIYGTQMHVKINGVEEGAEALAHHNHEDHHHDHDHYHHDHDHHSKTDHTHEHDHEHDHSHHHHASLAHIISIIDSLNVPDKVKDDTKAVYQLIAEAESKAHRTDVSEIHFHEVGTKDAIADVASVSLLMNKLSPDYVIASPVNVGFGHVHCAHGILPIPAPATAYLLEGIPTYSGQIEGEMCTPTGAALLSHFVDEFGKMPVMTVERIGYGMGKKDFAQANCVRTFLGNGDKSIKESEEDNDNPEMVELSVNIDDMTAEEIGFAISQIFEAGAAEVFTTPVEMKKSRPGTLLTILCRKDIKDTIIPLIFKHTTTIGIREKSLQRHILNRTFNTINTSFGPVQIKISSGYGVHRKKYEYDDLSRIAKEHDMSIEEVRAAIEKEIKEEDE